jgi:hypothetical protein
MNNLGLTDMVTATLAHEYRQFCSVSPSPLTQAGQGSVARLLRQTERKHPWERR